VSDIQRSLQVNFQPRSSPDEPEDDFDELEDLVVIDEGIVEEYIEEIQDSLPADYLESSVHLTIKQGGRPSLEGRPFQVFPAIDAKVFATNGEITSKGSRGKTGLIDVVTFSGSDTASANLPITNLTNVVPLTNVYSETGQKVAERPRRDPKTYGLVVDQPIYGTFKIEYSTTYKQYYWRHTGDEDEEIYIQGVVIAYHDGASASLEFDDVDGAIDFDKTEIYRVTSKYVVDSEGAWEYPPGWPDNPEYEQSSTNETPDNTSYQVLERVHFLGWVNKRGVNTYEWWPVYREQPFEGHSSYEPQYLLTLNTNAPDGFEQAFDSLDFGKIKAEIRRRYPNVTGA
jgi:hypothetical protein